jgi:hypothetical protein
MFTHYYWLYLLDAWLHLESPVSFAIAAIPNLLPFPRAFDIVSDNLLALGFKGFLLGACVHANTQITGMVVQLCHMLVLYRLGINVAKHTKPRDEHSP